MENLNQFITTITWNDGAYQMNLYNDHEKIWVQEIPYAVISLKMFSKNSHIFIAVMVQEDEYRILFYTQDGKLRCTWK